jgi:hypothetical protein
MAMLNVATAIKYILKVLICSVSFMMQLRQKSAYNIVMPRVEPRCPLTMLGVGTRVLELAQAASREECMRSARKLVGGFSFVDTCKYYV